MRFTFDFQTEGDMKLFATELFNWNYPFSYSGLLQNRLKLVAGDSDTMPLEIAYRHAPVQITIEE